MDRQIIYPGSIPLDTDLLNIQRYTMTAIGALARMLLGEAPLIDGMACTPGGGGDYSVTVGPGTCAALLNRDYTPFGSLPADGTLVMQMAQHPTDTVLQLAGPPARELVVCWLIQASLTETDTGEVALPYWNAGNPSVPFTGPSNSGLPQATKRLLRLDLSAKASAPEPFPIGTPPPPDAGKIPLYAVTTFWEKPGIVAGDIVEASDAPTLRYTLPTMPPGPSGQEVITLDTLWRAPPRVRRVRVRLVGGGGGGGGGNGGFSGGGGGSGGYAEAFVPVVPGQLYSIVIGSGGAPGVADQSGSLGGETAFDRFVRATGGHGGGAQNPDSHGGAPGTGTAGTILLGGGFGGDGAPLAQIPGGNGGASAFGGGGRGAEEGGGPANGLAAGSGGGGGYGAGSPGGQGANGMVVIEY